MEGPGSGLKARPGLLLLMKTTAAASFGRPHVAGSRAGRAGAHSLAVRAFPGPSSGDRTRNIRYLGQKGLLACNSGAGIFAAKSPGGTGPLPAIRGHELSGTASFPVNQGIRVSTLLRADPD